MLWVQNNVFVASSFAIMPGTIEDSAYGIRCDPAFYEHWLTPPLLPVEVWGLSFKTEGEFTNFGAARVRRRIRFKNDRCGCLLRRNTDAACSPHSSLFAASRCYRHADVFHLKPHNF